MPMLIIGGSSSAGEHLPKNHLNGLSAKKALQKNSALVCLGEYNIWRQGTICSLCSSCHNPKTILIPPAASSGFKNPRIFQNFSDQQSCLPVTQLTNPNVKTNGLVHTWWRFLTGLFPTFYIAKVCCGKNAAMTHLTLKSKVLRMVLDLPKSHKIWIERL